MQTNNRAKTLNGTTLKDTRLSRIDLLTFPSLQEYLADIELDTSHTNQIMTQSADSGHWQETQRGAIQVPPIIQEAVRFLRASLPATIKIATTFERPLPGVTLDGAYIHQVLINLCTNAVDAMEGSGGRLEIAVSSKTFDDEAARRIPNLKAGRYLVITISDKGHGIDHETLQHIFEPFFTTKKAGKGTGLGLFIVDYIVTRHGGSVNVSSRLGQGTTCTVYLPAVDIKPFQAQHASASAPDNRRKCILFVDDDHLLVQLSTRKLQFLNYAVSSFQRSEEALQAFRDNQYQFDAVITDHHMPGMDGQQLAREMLRLRPNLPIIMLSGYMRPDDAERIRQLGVREVLTKSDALKQIEEILDRIFGHLELRKKLYL